jgi:protein-S-isoprenylcysteine O-methyltransferase Ste14
MRDDRELRDQAVRGLRRKRAFGRDVVAYVVVSLLLIGVWYFATGHGYFWPGWVLLGWGVLLALHAWKVYGRGREITEADIERETERLRGPHEPPEQGSGTAA